MGHLLVAVAALLSSVACSQAELSPQGTKPPSQEPGSATTAPGAGALTLTDVDGYRFEVGVRNDPTFGPDAAAPWAWSPVGGIGVRCGWTRIGPPVESAVEIWGAPGDVQPSGAGFAPMDTGAHSLRESGLPRNALLASDRAEAVCGLRDGAGDHGVRIVVILERRGSGYAATKTNVLLWRG